MRHITMRQVIRESDGGKVEMSAEQEAEVKKTGGLAMELSEILLSFMRLHGEEPPEVVGVALLQRAAVHLMAGYDMSPADFGALAEGVATAFQEEARELRKRALNIGHA